jgi:xanthine dehydrogenase YagR molybdenum-binding subunit
VRGAVVWGIGAALRERSEVDPRYGGFLNTDMAEYVIPANADIGRLDIVFVDRPDHVLNPMGVKRVGEVALAGVAAALANAVHHATGRWTRRLPIMIEDVSEGRDPRTHAPCCTWTDPHTGDLQTPW